MDQLLLKKAIKLFKQDYSLRQIENELGVNRKLLSFELKQLGFDIKARSKGTSGMQKYHLNENVFEVIDTEEKAYWLGFLYADGYINKFGLSLELCLKKEDERHIESFLSFLQSNHPITNKKEMGKLYPKVAIGSKKLCQDLIDKGCVNNKSLVLTFPTHDIVPKHLIHHFMRGYYDGDGSLVIRKPDKKNREVTPQCMLFVIGTENFLDGFSKMLKSELNISLSSYTAEGKAFRLKRHGNPVVGKTLAFLYKDATIFLERKYKRYINSPCKTS